MWLETAIASAPAALSCRRANGSCLFNAGSAPVAPRIELRTPIVPAELHDDAGIIGAALRAPTG
jgi:hypothetical protein